jgi:hypothetical protein
MDLLGDVGQMEAHFGPFEDSVISTQDWCTICAELAIGSKIILGTPDGILGDKGHVEAHFGPFRDSVNLA